MNKNKKKLIRKAINGDSNSFAILLLNMQNKLYFISYSRLKNESDSQDAIQNTIIIAYDNLTKLKNIDSFNSWIIKILINECNKIYFQKKKIDYIENETLELDSYEDNFEDLKFNDLIKNLSTKEQLILTLYYKSGYSIKEIAQNLNIKENNIKSILSRSRKKLKKLLEENNYE